jgi:hypothetical protein
LVLADDRGEHRLHLPRRQLRQQHLAPVRAEVEADVSGITADRGCGRDVRETSQCASQSPTVKIPPDPPSAGLRSRASASSASTAAFRNG